MMLLMQACKIGKALEHVDAALTSGFLLSPCLVYLATLANEAARS